MTKKYDPINFKEGGIKISDLIKSPLVRRQLETIATRLQPWHEASELSLRNQEVDTVKFCNQCHRYYSRKEYDPHDCGASKSF